ncbi:TonB-dependent receptor [Vulcaniibacterium tengchongense]|uniref:Iron complex outermembrane receptor protein n=1 Tax=Vulcaniibacterium tengchongense TaxID=1273429 RepID=A0A3N4V216_9GAMM|nr:TonB-dependent receptor [Vulcaniibacterium tengchongense]RPE76976.1 iron complex outermembrane receptor protein [Vulcaniibacterium tengchongense]
MKLRAATLRLAILQALALGTLASPASYAQETATDPQATTLDRIEVTGSRIRRTDSETSSPIQTISRQEIDRTGKNTIAEYLQTLAVDGQGSVPKSFGTGFSPGGAAVSLRGLGAGSTLVLLNGRRLAPYGLADDGQKIYTDLSTIPLDAVERVEVLKDGASAIYGSDAIAGVVNIILRRDFQGGVAKASYGTSEDGGGAQRKGSITLGIGDVASDGYNAFVTLEAGKTDNIAMADRRDRKWIGTGDLRPWGYGYNHASGLTGFLNAGVATNSPVGAVRDSAGVYHYLNGCEQLSNVPNPTEGDGCLWEVGKFRDIAPSEEFVNLFSRGTWVLNESTELYAELGYSKKETEFVNTPSAVSGTWGYPGGAVVTNSGPDAMTISGDHPDNTIANGGTGQTGRIRYSAWDVGPRVSNIDNQAVRLLFGVKGVAGAWDYDAGYLHSESDLVYRRNGFLLLDRVRQVLNDGGNSPVGWWRLGANAGLNSQALYDYIAPTLTSRGDTKLDSIDASFSRSLMDLRGGSLGLALGLEYRRQEARLLADEHNAVGNVIGLGYSGFDGVDEVASGYAELNAPVLESLELNGAVRVDKYIDGESAVTPKFGVKWKPADWIALRGTYGEGFRAPNAAERAGQFAAFTNATDPVRCPGGSPYPGANPAPTCGVATVGLINTGNPDLKPEESKNYTIGVVFSPTPNTSLTLDAWRIKRENEINAESLDAALAAGRVLRSDDNLIVNGVPVPGTGTLLAALTSYINSASTEVRGVDLDARQMFELGAAGKLTLSLQWSHISSFERTDGDTTFDYAGTHGNCDVTNCIGTPKDKINLGVTWDLNPDFGVSLVGNYRSDMDNIAYRGSEDGCLAVFNDAGDEAPRGCRIPSFYTVDLSTRWSPAEGWELFGSVQNLTDRVAPLDPTTYGAINYNPMDFSGAVGRYYTLGVKYTFQ